jgi:hypothetical protein
MRPAWLLTARRLALVSVTRRQHRYKAVPAGYKTFPVQGGYGVVFANPGTNAERRHAGSRYNADRSCYMSPVAIFAMSTGAVSRYNPDSYRDDRSRKTVKVYWI